MDSLIQQGFKAKCSFKEEDSQFLAVLEIEGIDERFSTYSDNKLAARSAAASLAQAFISSNAMKASQLYAGGTQASPDKEETPNQMLKRLYPESEVRFEFVCFVQVGEEEFQERGYSRGVAKLRASARALESLNGATFDMERLESYFKKDMKDCTDIEKHPASALHEIVGNNAVFSFREETSLGSDWKIFICTVVVNEKVYSGKAHNKRLAKYNTALNALKRMGLMERFKIMPPPVSNIPEATDTGSKRRTSESIGFMPGEDRKRGRGARGGVAGDNTRYFNPGMKVDTPPRYDRGRPRARGRGAFRSRGGPIYRGRDQAVGGQPPASFPPPERYDNRELGYRASNDLYPSYTNSYNQFYDPGYNSGYGYAQPNLPVPPPPPPHQPARGRPFPEQMGNTGFSGYLY